MANIFTQLGTTINRWVEDRISAVMMIPGAVSKEDATRKTLIEVAREYAKGNQPPPLMVKLGQTNDNVIVNLTGLVRDRATALLFGEGVEFDLPGEGDTPESEYIEAVWEANDKDELLQDTSDYGVTGGTPCFQINPGAIYKDGVVYPEILCIDPAYLTIKTEPENYRRVAKYVIQYKVRMEEGDRERNRKREIIPLKSIDEATGAETISSWEIHDYIEGDNGTWIEMNTPVLWNYSFPPILPFKNLPNAGSPYGKPDITPDVLHLQDAINRVVSNANKVLRLMAHQRLFGKMFGSASRVDVGPDSILNSDNPDADLKSLDPTSDFAGMTGFGELLREALFTIARSSDPQGIKDKVGQITNFGLSILYKDAIDKLKTKRKLYGEALKELNRRLLILNDMEPDPGDVIWAEALPQNEGEEIRGYEFDLRNGIASVQTIRQKRGYDEETEKERIEAEQQEAVKNADNIGGGMLQNFNKGAPNQQPRNIQQMVQAMKK